MCSSMVHIDFFQMNGLDLEVKNELVLECNCGLQKKVARSNGWGQACNSSLCWKRSSHDSPIHGQTFQRSAFIFHNSASNGIQ